MKYKVLKKKKWARKAQPNAPDMAHKVQKWCLELGRTQYLPRGRLTSQWVVITYGTRSGAGDSQQARTLEVIIQSCNKYTLGIYAVTDAVLDVGGLRAQSTDRAIWEVTGDSKSARDLDSWAKSQFSLAGVESTFQMRGPHSKQ